MTIKRVGNKTNEKMNNFGENWVYAYDLPYDISKQEGELMIEWLEKSYGKIVQYSIHPYRNMIEKTED